MGRQEYLVSADDRGWKIHYLGGDFRYDTEAEAVTAARAAAREAFAKGGTSLVLIQQADGVWKTDVTYGDDPRPVRG